MTHPFAKQEVDLDREDIDVRTDYSIHQIANSPFLFLNHHEKNYNKQVGDELYQKNPDHYWKEHYNNKPLTKKDTCNGIPDIRKIFYSARNLSIIAQYTHRRVLCYTTKQFSPDKNPQIKTIYPAIDVAENATNHPLLYKIFSPKNLQPLMDQTYRIYGEYISDDVQKQIDKLNYIVIVECSNKILTNIKFHLYYLADSSGTLSIWDRPMNASNSISYTLPSQKL